MIQENARFIDPLTIPEKDLPLIVLSDDRRGFLGFGIKAHTHGNYNHAMVMHKKGYFASQNPGGYKEIPLETYLKPHITLKFWQYTNMSAKKKKALLKAIQSDLKAPWYKTKYDYLGIVGQFLRIRWLNNPWASYCSERVAVYCRKIWKLIIRYKPSPSELNEDFKKIVKMKVYGYYLPD